MKNLKTQAVAAVVRYAAEQTGLVRKPSLVRRGFNRITRKESYDTKVAKKIEDAALAAARRRNVRKARRALKETA